MLNMQTSQKASLTGHGEVTTSVLMSACLTTVSAFGLNKKGDLRIVFCSLPRKTRSTKKMTRQRQATPEQCFLLDKAGASNVSHDPNCWSVFVLNMMVMVFWGFVCLFVCLSVWFVCLFLFCVVCFCCSGYMWSLFIKFQALGCHLKFCITTNSDVHFQISSARGILTRSL